MGPVHAALDQRHRLRAAAAFAAFRAFGIGPADRIDREIAELAIKEAVIGAAAEFAVGDEFEAELFLQRDGAADSSVFGCCELRLIDLAAREASACRHQFGRPQQAADMLSTEWRLGHGL